MIHPIIKGIGIACKLGIDLDNIKNIIQNQKNSEKYYQEDEIEFPETLTKQYRRVCQCARLGVLVAATSCQDSAYTIYGEETGMTGGVYCGTQFGGYYMAQIALCQALQSGGPAPVIAVNNGYHLTSDLLAIRYGITGKNTTSTAGPLASGYALMEAYDDLVHSRLKHALVVGTDTCSGILESTLTQLEKSHMWSFGAASLLLSTECITNNDEPTVYLKFINVSRDICQETLAELIDNKNVGYVITNLPNIEKLSGKSNITAQWIYMNHYFGDVMGAKMVLGVAVAALLCKTELTNCTTVKNLLVMIQTNNQIMTAIIGV